MSKITHIQMYANTDVSVTSFWVNCEDRVSLDFSINSVIRYSILGNMLTIEDCQGDPSSLNGEIKLPIGTTLKLKSVVVLGSGLLTIHADDTDEKLTLKIFHDGGLDMKCDDNHVFTKLQLSNHGSGKIRGYGNQIEILKIQNTGSGSISGFLVEKELVALISGSGHTTIDKFSNCLTTIRKIANSTGKLTFI